MHRLELCATPPRERPRFRSRSMMKRTTAMVLGAMLVLATVTPAAMAQSIQIPGFPSNFPWFTNEPQAQTFEQFLASHPDDRARTGRQSRPHLRSQLARAASAVAVFSANPSGCMGGFEEP